MKNEYDQLKQFFGSYFHQDWDFDGDTWEDVIKAYRISNGVNDQRILTAQLDNLIKDIESGNANSNTFQSDFNCEYNFGADGLSVLEWITKINAILKDGTPS